MDMSENEPCPCGSGLRLNRCCGAISEGLLYISRPNSSSLSAELDQLVDLFNAGRHSDLEIGVRTLLERHPDSGLAWKLLSASLQMQGKNAQAALQKAVLLLPDDIDVRINLANVLHDQGELSGAVENYRRALEIAPDFAEVHNNLGAALQDLEQFDQAVASYRKALAIQPDYAEAHSNMGNAFKALGRFDDAVTSYRRALELEPDFADAHFNLGVAFKELGRLDDAVSSYRRALTFKPSEANTHYNLGNAYKDLGRYHDAVTSYRQALALKPDFAEAHNNLGTALQDIGQFDDAAASFRRALEINPDFVDARGNFLFALNYTAGHTASFCLDEARQYGRLVSKMAVRRFFTWRCVTQPERLRVGVVSGDLRNHPVGYFLESLLAHFDPARIELVAYPTSLVADKLTARIGPRFAAWKPLFGQGDEAAARLIHADGVHVLLDLSGHTANNRLPMFAWKPAPVQASWLGYFATTGVAEMDYFLADEVSVPEYQREHFTESVRYIPETRWCFTPPDVDLPVASLPALQNGRLTFGSFQNLAKVGDGVLKTWGAILAALPEARLRWQCKQFGDPAVAAQVALRLRQLGIDSARVTLLGNMSRRDYLAAHAEVDVILDTFPFTGGTTTCEALWMGVPTLSLAGETLVARQGASLLTAAGLQDWVAANETSYIEKAISLNNSLPKLTSLRAGLRAQVLASPLCDAPRFARNFEAALWGMWRRWQVQQ